MRPMCMVLVALGSVLLLEAGAALAVPPTPAQRCTAAKLLAAGAEVRAALFCTRNVSPSCMAAAARRRDLAFARADRSGSCAVTEDSTTLGDAVGALVATALAALGPPGAEVPRCAVALYGAAARAAGAIARAHVRDVRRPDAARRENDLAKAEEQLARTFTGAAALGYCSSPPDATGVFRTLADGIAGLRALLGERCGNGLLEGEEQCEGATCDLLPDGPDGCSAPGTGGECRCCAATTPCYVRGSTPEPVEVPCCTGVCEIPGPEAGPDVTVYCSEPPAPPCPCWTSALLDATFPTGYFDANGRGGVSCELPTPLVGFSARNGCTLNGPAGMSFTFPRGGAALVGEHTCVLFPDLDPGQTGSCSGPPLVQSTTAEQSAACFEAMQTSEAYQDACL